MGMMATYRLENSRRKGERTSPLVSRPTRLKNYIRRMDALNSTSRLAVPSLEEMPSVRDSIIRHFLSVRLLEHRWIDFRSKDKSRGEGDAILDFRGSVTGEACDFTFAWRTQRAQWGLALMLMPGASIGSSVANKGGSPCWTRRAARRRAY